MRRASFGTAGPYLIIALLGSGCGSDARADDPGGSLPGTAGTDSGIAGGLASPPLPFQCDDGVPPGDTLSADPYSFGPIPVEESPFDVIWDSIFAKMNPRDWRPLLLRFSEGWNEPWIEPPGGSKRAPRRGWINAADGNFYRNWFFVYAFAHKRINGGNGRLGQYVLYAPLNCRLGLIINVPLIGVNGTASRSSVFPPSLGAPSPTKGSGFGDITYTPRAMLFETRDAALAAQVTLRTPTGTPRSGDGGRASLTPQLQFWTNVADRWVVRGGFGVTAPTNQVVIWDQAGYHAGTELVVPHNISLILLPPHSPELNPMENLWHYLRSHHWSNRVYRDYDELEAEAIWSLCKVCLDAELVKTVCAAPYINMIV